MALDPFITPETYEKLAPALKSEYLQKDNEYQLDVRRMEKEIVHEGQKKKAIFALEDVGGLRSALQNERTAKEAAEKLAAAAKDLDIPKAKQALIDVETMKTWTSEDKLTAKMKDRDEQLERKHKAEMEPVVQKLSRKQSQLEKVLIENAAVVALTQAGVKPEGITLLLPHVKNFIKLEETPDGEVSTKIVDEYGKARVSLKPNNTGPMDIAELIEDMRRKPAYAPAFPGSGSTGSGTTSNAGRSGGSNGAYTITTEEAKDFALYSRRKEEAQKAGRFLQVVD